MEKHLQPTPSTVAALQLRLLGPLTVLKDGAALPLPASRKVRALLAYLTMEAGGARRSRLCELLWDRPDDPRGELRWALSKLRGVVDNAQRHRLQAHGDAIALDLSDCLVDATRINDALQAGAEKLDVEQLRTLAALFMGDFAEGLELERNPQLSNWLTAQRRRFRALHVTVLAALVDRLADDANASFQYLEKWLQLTPFDRRVHELLLNTLLRCGRVQEADEHLATTIRQFETEGLEWLSLREAWKTARARVQSVPAAEPTRLQTRIGANVSRASICVMPFIDRAPSGGTRSALADGLTEDIITRLAKLRILFVIARGSVFALGEHSILPEEAARLLKVDYVASGSVRRHGDRVTVTVEVAETTMSRVVWVDEFNCRIDDALTTQDEICNKIVASIAKEVEVAERNRAMLKPPNSLTAWEAYHRGLWHMYRFNGQDNERAAHFFQRALRQDATFARAHAGLSFTHFQNAFLHRTQDREKEIARAFETAGESLIADDRDPAAHWAMGRALWLRGEQDQALRELEMSVNLSPNFALGHYTLGFVHGQSGDPRVAIACADHSRHLSPFDPLLFGMLASRALALVRLGQYQEAANWALKGAARPNAHVHILTIAANCLAMADRFEEAAGFVTSLRRAVPNYRLDDFLAAFRFGTDATAAFRTSAARIGLN